MNTNHRLATALALLVIAGLAPACSTFGSEESSSPAASGPAPGGDGDGSAAPKAKPVDGTPDSSDINETLGVFVAPSGNATNEGSRERPLATLQAGIDLGKKVGKRVYVCTGTYREALTLVDSISILGGLDCSAPIWKLGAAKSRVESPAIPAIIAKDIASPTRVEGLDVVAPNATVPSSSSIGMQAVRSPGLVIASSKITAGNGANGTDGSDGVQLVQQGAVNGTNSLAAAECVKNVTCGQYGFQNTWVAYIAPGGTSICAGADGHNGLPGGFGGAGELDTLSSDFVNYHYDVYASALYGESKPGTAGSDGTDAPVGGAFGTFTENGYVPATGNAGTDGSPGNGGRGGRGGSFGLPDASTVAFGHVWRAMSGDAGGGGGCPGLAGSPGTGGGASIALALLESPLVLDGAELVSSKAGDAGKGAFGSDATAGGAAGVGWSVDPIFTGRAGGRGGLAGISTNGSNGPSLGVVHSGAGPKVSGGTKIIPGPGGAAIDAQVRIVLGVAKTIPATGAGLSEAVHAL